MIAQGLGTMIWNKGLINWIKPILAIGRGDKTVSYFCVYNKKILNA